MPQSRSTNAWRGLVAATFSTFVALFSHVIAGGAMPGVLGVVVPLVLSTTVCVLLAGRRLSLVRLSISVTISQFLFHTLFVLGTGGGSTSIAPMTPGHAMGGSAMVIDVSRSVPMGHDASWMWVAHVVAGLLTVVALHRGETIFMRLVDGKEFVLTWLMPVFPVVGTPPLAVPHVAIGLTGALLVPMGVYPSTAASRRGPPVLAFS